VKNVSDSSCPNGNTLAQDSRGSCFDVRSKRKTLTWVANLNQVYSRVSEYLESTSLLLFAVQF
jgi:hypothetical protein